jgi:hypothetical protein
MLHQNALFTGCKFKLDAVKHPSEVLSVEAWIKIMSTDVLFYKALNNVDQHYPSLKFEDFVLIPMTDGQKNMLEKYGNDCICIDGTHGENGYGLKLTTLLINKSNSRIPLCIYDFTSL